MIKLPSQDGFGLPFNKMFEALRGLRVFWEDNKDVLLPHHIKRRHFTGKTFHCVQHRELLCFC